ncbi:MAG: DUF1289 domain-containing protein [Rhodocyclaceae bacterium]|nr:DUF1289 domain-containing protein [Rhodocyclaceae bacterium]
MDKAFTPTPVRSPCVKVCEMDEAVGLCKGCCRTQDERDWWVAYSDAQQREVLRRCDQRREALGAGCTELAPSMGPVEPKRKG